MEARAVDGPLVGRGTLAPKESLKKQFRVPRARVKEGVGIKGKSELLKKKGQRKRPTLHAYLSHNPVNCVMVSKKKGNRRAPGCSIDQRPGTRKRKGTISAAQEKEWLGVQPEWPRERVRL